MIIWTEYDYVDFVPFYLTGLSVIASDCHTLLFAPAEFQGNYICICAYANYHFYLF
jgi:hypothetical protein